MIDTALTSSTLFDAIESCAEKPKVTIYTDGACSGNPGPGGYGAVFLYKELEDSIHGGQSMTTNNRMEMMAVIEALRILPRGCDIELYTDSMYVSDGLNLWLQKWKRNGWKTSSNTPVKNKDLWQELDLLQQRHSINWHWVKGHSGDRYNEKADDLARSAIVMEKFKA